MAKGLFNQMFNRKLQVMTNTNLHQGLPISAVVHFLNQKSFLIAQEDLIQNILY